MPSNLPKVSAGGLVESSCGRQVPACTSASCDRQILAESSHAQAFKDCRCALTTRCSPSSPHDAIGMPSTAGDASTRRALAVAAELRCGQAPLDPPLSAPWRDRRGVGERTDILLGSCAPRDPPKLRRSVRRRFQPARCRPARRPVATPARRCRRPCNRRASARRPRRSAPRSNPSGRRHAAARPPPRPARRRMELPLVAPGAVVSPAVEASVSDPRRDLVELLHAGPLVAGPAIT